MTYFGFKSTPQIPSSQSNKYNPQYQNTAGQILQILSACLPWYIMPSLQDRSWIRLWKSNSPDIRQRIVEWRRQDAVTRIERPSRPQRARRLGYKAKQGIIVVRMRVGTGGMRKQRPRGGRRPKHLGVTRIKADVSMKQVAENRVLERYPNMMLLGSYFVYKDGIHYWFEVILADPAHPRVSGDLELRRRLIPAAA